MAADPTAFQDLNDAELAELEKLGVRRAVTAGEYLYREGDADYDFYVVLAGAVEIVINSEGKERVIARHDFLGELNLVTGQRVFVSARVAEPGDVIVVPRDALLRLIATDASLSDKILAAFLARRGILMSGAASAIRVIGSQFSPDSGRVREFLIRSHIPHGSPCRTDSSRRTESCRFSSETRRNTARPSFARRLYGPQWQFQRALVRSL